jgi:diacylglycerol kinase (ATP)
LSRGFRPASFADAARGIRALIAEPNARVQLAVALAVVALGLWLGDIDPREWALLVLAIGLVLAAEAANTALEALADRVAPDAHPLVGKAKDLAAGGVLIASIAAALVGVLVLGAPLWRRLF